MAIGSFSVVSGTFEQAETITVAAMAETLKNTLIIFNLRGEAAASIHRCTVSQPRIDDSGGLK
jgi:hypothetical protein